MEHQLPLTCWINILSYNLSSRIIYTFEKLSKYFRQLVYDIFRSNEFWHAVNPDIQFPRDNLFRIPLFFDKKILQDLRLYLIKPNNVQKTIKFGRRCITENSVIGMTILHERKNLTASILTKIFMKSDHLYKFFSIFEPELLNSVIAMLSTPNIYTDFLSFELDSLLYYCNSNDLLNEENQRLYRKHQKERKRIDKEVKKCRVKYLEKQKVTKTSNRKRLFISIVCGLCLVGIIVMILF